VSAPAIEVDGVFKAFGPTQALSDVSLQAEPGRVLGLLGPNGAGKTTLVRVLTTLLRPDSGHARVAGYDVVRQASALRSAIGLAGDSGPAGALAPGIRRAPAGQRHRRCRPGPRERDSGRVLGVAVARLVHRHPGRLRIRGSPPVLQVIRMTLVHEMTPA
jgi:energy-coupling factor transporter ATP-binding protein EcfA2